MASEEDAALQERLKSALWYAVGKAVDEETLHMGANATPQFIGAMTEMIWAHLENIAHDLEAFAEHAGRKTITTDDVMLLTRRNEGLESVMREFLDGLKVHEKDMEEDEQPKESKKKAAGTKRKAR